MHYFVSHKPTVPHAAPRARILTVIHVYVRVLIIMLCKYNIIVNPYLLEDYYLLFPDKPSETRAYLMIKMFRRRDPD